MKPESKMGRRFVRVIEEGQMLVYRAHSVFKYMITKPGCVVEMAVVLAPKFPIRQN
jgi:hypothetical protein